MALYELSNAADEDFENIFGFGIDTFGLDQAMAYQRSMIKRLEALAERPMQYPAVDQIHVGYRRSVYHSHSIYYKIEPTRIFIVRILGQQDPKKALKV